MSRPPKTTTPTPTPEQTAMAPEETALAKPEEVMTKPSTTPAEPKQVRPLYLGYVRVSTAEQADSGLGLEAQSAALFAEAERRGWDTEVLADRGASGKLINPGLRKALDLLAAGRADGLLVSKMDRLARSSRHAAEILDLAQDQGWNLVLMDMGIDLSTPPGRAMASMLATFAQFERELISARTRDALAARKASGKRLGRPSSIPAAILNRIVSEREAGRSFPMIAAGLSADGVVSPTGLRTWNESTVRRAFRSATEHAAECGTQVEREAVA